MGIYATDIDVDEQHSLVGKVGTLNPDCLTAEFDFVKGDDCFEDLSATDSFEIVRHYNFGTFCSVIMSSEVAGPGVSETSAASYEFSDEEGDKVLDISRVDVKTEDGREYTLPGSAVLLSEHAPS